MPLVKAGRLIDDPYIRVADDAPIPDNVPVIVPAAHYLAHAANFATRAAQTGVLWPNDRRIADLEPFIGRLSLIALVFPSFRDGRAYSQARRLREQYGFGGELRATGDVLRDQFLFLLRAGFDALEVKKAADLAAFAEAVNRFTVFYQASADGRTPAQRRRLLRSAKERQPRRVPKQA